MKRYTVQVKLADYQKDWRPAFSDEEEMEEVRKMVWTDMHSTDDAQDAEDRMYGYRRRNYIARVIDNAHPSRT